MKLFTRKEADIAKREQDNFQALQEKSLLDRINTLQKSFNTEMSSISEYRQQMNDALEDESLWKMNELNYDLKEKKLKKLRLKSQTNGEI
jgi:hypothetical protein